MICQILPVFKDLPELVPFLLCCFAPLTAQSSLKILFHLSLKKQKHAVRDLTSRLWIVPRILVPHMSSRIGVKDNSCSDDEHRDWRSSCIQLAGCRVVRT